MDSNNLFEKQKQELSAQITSEENNIAIYQKEIAKNCELIKKTVKNANTSTILPISESQSSICGNLVKLQNSLIKKKTLDEHYNSILEQEKSILESFNITL